MSEIDLKFLDEAKRVFVDHRAPSLADLRAQIAALPPTIRLRDLLFALDAVPRIFSRELTSVAASPRVLRDLFKNGMPAKAAIKPKTFANVRSGVIAAVREYAPAVPSITRRIPLNAPWKELLAPVADEEKFP